MAEGFDICDDSSPDSNSESDPSDIIPDSVIEGEKKCCVCMRKDTKLLHLCLVNGGGHSLFPVLCDVEDDGNKDPMRLIICWECDANMSKVVRFRNQACKAQKRLSSIAEGHTIQNTFVLIPPISAARNAGPGAILEYRTQMRADPSQPLLRVVRYVLPDGSAANLPSSGDGVSQSSLQEFLEGIHQ